MLRVRDSVPFLRKALISSVAGALDLSFSGKDKR